MGDRKKAIPVIFGILITGLLFAVNFEQDAYAENTWSTANLKIGGGALRSVDFYDANNGLAIGDITLKTFCVSCVSISE